LPLQIAGSGNLYLWFPIGHTYSKVMQFFQQEGHEIEVLADRQGLRVPIQASEIQHLAVNLVEVLSRRELQDIQVLFMEGTAVPQLRDFPRTTSLQRLLTLSQSDWLLEMMAGQAAAVRELLQQQGCYSSIQIHPDLAGIERFALAYLNPSL
jgi:hypothetical protein